jgi:5-methylcytosine-specific restriction endonuclease McrA
VNRIQPKRPRLRLDPKPYDQLRKQVLRRDGWRCQICDSRQNLQVHHKQRRSQQGSDEDSNLITLCASCHEDVHRMKQ